MPSNKIIWKFLQKAKEASEQSTFPRQHLGSVLVYGNKIIAVGFNTNKTNPKQFIYNKYRSFKEYYSKNNGVLHAEMNALIKARFLDIDWSKATLYVYRELKNGELALARPCVACQAYLLEKGVGTVIFTVPDGFRILKLKGDYYEQQ